MKRFMFLAVVAVLCLGSAFAQQQQTQVEWTATISAVPLTIALNNDVAYTGLRPGVSYMTVCDPTPAGTTPTNIVPFDVTAAETFVPGYLTVTGDAGSSVTMTFVLPSRLYAQAGAIGYIDMTYDVRSAAWTFGGAGSMPLNLFNPQNGLTTYLDGAGVLDVYLGGNPAVSPDANDAGGGILFVGDGLATVAYTGMGL